MAETDWSATPLGPIPTWPQALRIAVDICMHSRFPMFVWWGPSLVNLYNDAYAPMLGQRHPAAFGRPAAETWSEIWDVVGPQAEQVMHEGRATWNERVKLVMQRNGFDEDTWFTWSYSPIRDELGHIGGVFCAVTEETGRVVAERERDRLMREAQDAAQTLRAWFDNAPGFIALLRGPQFVFELVNHAYRQLVGHRDVEGLPLFEAIPDAAGQGFEQLLQRVYESGEPFVGRGLRLRLQPSPDAAPTEAYLDLVYQPVFDAERRVVGIFVQGQEVTEQVRALQALQDADRRKDEFLATLSHELRNPLAPIRQAARLARASDAPPTQRLWALDVIERQARHMTLLVDDLLDVSRISRGRLELRVRAVQLDEVVEAAVETARPLLEARRHALTLSLPPEAVTLSADPVRLAQVLSNLLSNAARYTGEGGAIELAASLEGDEVAIAVRDNGIGLAPESLDEIFDMFTQVGGEGAVSGGLGIGLALSRGLVQMHGGQIVARSEGLGRGSEFIVRLPLRRVAEPRAADRRPDAAAARTAPGRAGLATRRRVLIADDNIDAADSLAALLEIDGHEVHVARDGDDALDAAGRLRPDVAVLDIGMPGRSGYDVAQSIRRESWGARVRLVALTGWGQADDLARARAAGFDHHVTKPVDLARLQALIAD